MEYEPLWDNPVSAVGVPAMGAFQFNQIPIRTHTAVAVQLYISPEQHLLNIQTAKLHS